MTKLLCNGNDIGFTILAYTPVELDEPNRPIQQELIANPSDFVLGYVTNGKFTYTDAGGLTEANHHWSLDI